MAMDTIGSGSGGTTGMSFDWGKGKTNFDGTTVKQRQLSQEAIDKFIYNTLSSDQGLAALASGENLSAGFNSSSKTLLAQDMMTKLIGELALVTAPEVTEEAKTTRQDTKKIGGGIGTVICTELARQGYLDLDLYEEGGPPSKQVPYLTWVGYHVWAVKVAEAMQTSPVLCRALYPWVKSRYEFLAGRNRVAIRGRLTVYVGQPVCNLIGRIVTLGGKYGRSEEFA